MTKEPLKDLKVNIKEEKSETTEKAIPPKSVSISKVNLSLLKIYILCKSLDKYLNKELILTLSIN